jgi:hypothetical protein
VLKVREEVAERHASMTAISSIPNLSSSKLHTHAAHTWAVANTSDRSNTPIVVVVVAVVGLLATVGSAALGGYWANKSVESQSESQRSAEVQDQRREAYVDYVRVVGKWCQALMALDAGEITEDDANKVAFEVLTQAGRVRLIAGQELKEAVSTATTALVFEEPSTGPCASNDGLKDFLNTFIEAAQPDL